MTADLIRDWLWPAGGSGGLWGDLVAGLLQVGFLAVLSYIFWPPVRKRINAFVGRHKADLKAHHDANHASHMEELAEVKRHLLHIIEHSPGVPPLPEKKRSGP
jgi:hypothetical protein